MATRNAKSPGGNWTSTGSWVEGQVPTANDNVIIDIGSGTLNCNLGSGVCNDLTLTSGTLQAGGSSGGAIEVKGNLTATGGEISTLNGALTIDGNTTISGATISGTTGTITFGTNTDDTISISTTTFSPNDSLNLVFSGTGTVAGDYTLPSHGNITIAGHIVWSGIITGVVDSGLTISAGAWFELNGLVMADTNNHADPRGSGLSVNGTLVLHAYTPSSLTYLGLSNGGKYIPPAVDNTLKYVRLGAGGAIINSGNLAVINENININGIIYNTTPTAQAVASFPCKIVECKKYKSMGAAS